MDTHSTTNQSIELQKASNVMYGNFSGVSTALLEELHTFLENVYLQGETISFELLCSIFETYLNDEWNEQKLERACKYLFRSGHFSVEFWDKLERIP